MNDNNFEFPDFESNNIETNNALEITKTYKSSLSKRLPKNLKVSFAQSNNNYVAAFSRLSEAFSNDPVEADLKSLEDINISYKKINYNFIIYNSQYRFRVFRLVYSPLFPMKVYVDEDIAREMDWENGECDIYHNDDYYDFLGKLAKTTKFVSVIKILAKSK